MTCLHARMRARTHAQVWAEGGRQMIAETRLVGRRDLAELACKVDLALTSFHELSSDFMAQKEHLRAAETEKIWIQQSLATLQQTREEEQIHQARRLQAADETTARLEQGFEELQAVIEAAVVREGQLLLQIERNSVEQRASVAQVQDAQAAAKRLELEMLAFQSAASTSTTAEVLELRRSLKDVEKLLEAKDAQLREVHNAAACRAHISAPKGDSESQGLVDGPSSEFPARDLAMKPPPVPLLQVSRLNTKTSSQLDAGGREVTSAEAPARMTPRTSHLSKLDAAISKFETQAYVSPRTPRTPRAAWSVDELRKEEVQRLEIEMLAAQEEITRLKTELKAKHADLKQAHEAISAVEAKSRDPHKTQDNVSVSNSKNSTTSPAQQAAPGKMMDDKGKDHVLSMHAKGKNPLQIKNSYLLADYAVSIEEIQEVIRLSNAPELAENVSDLASMPGKDDTDQVSKLRAQVAKLQGEMKQMQLVNDTKLKDLHKRLQSVRDDYIRRNFARIERSCDRILVKSMLNRWRASVPRDDLPKTEGQKDDDGNALRTIGIDSSRRTGSHQQGQDQVADLRRRLAEQEDIITNLKMLAENQNDEETYYLLLDKENVISHQAETIQRLRENLEVQVPPEKAVNEFSGELADVSIAFEALRSSAHSRLEFLCLTLRKTLFDKDALETSLQSTVADLKQRLAATGKELDSLKIEHVDLWSAHALCEESMKAADTKQRTLQTDLDQERQRCTSLEERIRVQGAEHARKEEEAKSRLVAQTAALRDEMSKQIPEMEDECKRQLASLRLDFKQKEQQHLQQRQQHQKMLAERTKELEIARAAAATSASELQQMAKLLEEFNTLKATYSALAQEHAPYPELVTGLRAEVDGVTTKLESSLADLQALKEAHVTLSGEKKELEDERAALLKGLNSEKSRARDLAQEVEAKMQAAVKTAEDRIQQAQKATEDLRNDATAKEQSLLREHEEREKQSHLKAQAERERMQSEWTAKYEDLQRQHIAEKAAQEAQCDHTIKTLREEADNDRRENEAALMAQHTEEMEKMRQQLVASEERGQDAAAAMLEERKALLQRQHDLGARCQQLESDVQGLHAEAIAEQEKRQSLEDTLHCRLVAELDVEVADQQATADAEELVRLRADVADLQHDKAALQAHMADDKAALARVQKELEDERSAAQALVRALEEQRRNRQTVSGAADEAVSSGVERLMGPDFFSSSDLASFVSPPTWVTSGLQSVQALSWVASGVASGVPLTPGRAPSAFTRSIMPSSSASMLPREPRSINTDMIAEASAASDAPDPLRLASPGNGPGPQPPSSSAADAISDVGAADLSVSASLWRGEIEAAGGSVVDTPRDAIAVMHQLKTDWEQERKILQERIRSLETQVAMHSQTSDAEAIQWARSCQAAAEERLEILIADFDSQRRAAEMEHRRHSLQLTDTLQALGEEADRLRADVKAGFDARDAAVRQLEELVAKHSAQGEEMAQLVARATCAETQMGHQARLVGFLETRLKRWWLQDVWDQFVFKSRSAAEKAVARAAAHSAKLEIRCGDLQAELDRYHEDVRQLDAENEQLKDECQQLEAQATQGSAFEAHLKTLLEHQRRKVQEAEQCAVCLAHGIADCQHDLNSVVQGLRETLGEAVRLHASDVARLGSQVSALQEHEKKQLMLSDALQVQLALARGTLCRVQEACAELIGESLHAMGDAQAGLRGTVLQRRHLEQLEAELVSLRTSHDALLERHAAELSNVLRLEQELAAIQEELALTLNHARRLQEQLDKQEGITAGPIAGD